MNIPFVSFLPLEKELNNEKFDKLINEIVSLNREIEEDESV